MGKCESYLLLVFVGHDDLLEFEGARAEDSQRVVDGVALLVLRHNQSVTVGSSRALQNLAQVVRAVDANAINERCWISCKKL